MFQALNQCKWKRSRRVTKSARGFLGIRVTTAVLELISSNREPETGYPARDPPVSFAQGGKTSSPS